MSGRECGCGCRSYGRVDKPVSQDAQDRLLVIRWQRLVSGGKTCPRCSSTGEELDEAVRTLRQSLEPLGVEVRLEKEELDEDSFGRDPSSSNRIWFNDRSLEECIGGTIGHSRCCDVCGPVECRTVSVGGEVHETIPSGIIVRAGLAEASRLMGVKDGPCRE